MLHTKLPWIHQPDYNDVGNACIDISSEEGAHVVEIYDSHDAAFIVKAVNNHENLLNELDSLVRFIERQQKLGYLTHPEWVVRTRGAREVIKQAEAES